MVSKSPERHTFQRNSYIENCIKSGTEPNPDHIKMYEDWAKQDDEKMSNPEHIKYNMEYDLRTCDWMLEKVRNDDVYAQHLYAAICNNEFQKLDTWPILKGETCSYSWRYAGGIIADMQMKGDYIDWYCSGIKNNDDLDDDQFRQLSKEDQEHYLQVKAYVSESIVTDEICNDLQKLGWTVLDNDDN